jgi:5-methylcytosine-specific restriction endonuclease McrA
MPFHKERYPKNWKEISLRIRARSGGKCEFCGAENYKPHPLTGSKVVLTVAHLDHDPMNCDGMENVEEIESVPLLPIKKSNLRALCQKCHLTYDAKHHARNATTTRRNKIIGNGQLEFISELPTQEQS